MISTSSWFGEVPPNWEVKRLGALGTLAKGRGGTKDDDRESGVAVVRYGELYSKFGTVITEARSFISEEDARTYTPLPPGSIVFAASGESAEDIGKSALSRLAAPAFVGSDTVVFTPTSSGVDPVFLAHCLESQPLKALKSITASGFTVVHTNAGRLKTLPIPQPPIDTQRAIADYLDGATSQIDTLVAKQEQLITVLLERRASVVDALFAEASGPMVRLKRLFTPSSATSVGGEEVLSVYRDFGVVPKSSREGNFNRTPEDVSRYLRVNAGDLVVNKMKAWQGSLGLSSFSGIVSGDYEVARPTSASLLPAFAHMYLRSPRMISQYASRSTGIRPSQWRLYWGQLGNIEIPVPELPEQQRLVNTLQAQHDRIDRLVAKAEHFIELSRERRAALITAAVTGQINVTGEAADGDRA